MNIILEKLVALARPVFLVVLTAIAGYAYTQIQYLSLPISSALALFTVVLPLATGITTQGVKGLVKRQNKSEQNRLTLPLIAIIGFQLVYETVVATLALTYMIPPETLACGLDDKWQKFWRQKNDRKIRGIQDSLECCGLHSVWDRAWPFKQDAHEAGNCVDVTNRSQSCFGKWRQAEQINAGLLLLVAIIIFIIKVFSMINLLTNSSWKRSNWYQPDHQITEHDSEPEEDNRASMRRLIEEGDEEAGAYHDEAPRASSHSNGVSAYNNADEQGPRVLPSRLNETN